MGASPPHLTGFAVGISLTICLLLLLPSTAAQPAHSSSSPTAATGGPSLHHCQLPAKDRSSIIVYDPATQDLVLIAGLQIQYTQIGSFALIMSPDCHLYATVTLVPGYYGDLEQDAAYDPQNGWIYITYQFPNGYVIALNGTHVQATISSPNWENTYDIAYDPAVGGMAVSDNANDTVSFIVGTRVVGPFPAPGDPTQISYSPAGNLLLVATYRPNPGSKFAASLPDVTFLNASTGAFLGTPVTEPPYSTGAMAFDPLNNWTYAPTNLQHNLTARLIVFSSSGRIIKKLDIATGIWTVDTVYSPQDQAIFVSLESGAAIATGEIVEVAHLQVIHTIVLNSTVEITITGMVYDAADGHIFLVNADSDVLYDLWP
jgi:hypothetical protein